MSDTTNARKRTLQIFVTALAVLAQSPAWAGEPKHFNRLRVAQLQFSNKSLDAELQKGGFAASSGVAVVAGVAGNLLVGANNFIGAEANFAFPAKARTNDAGTFATRTISSCSAFLNLGGHLPLSNVIKISSSIGVGFGSTSVSLVELGSPTFDELLQSPRRGFLLTSTSPMFQLAVGPEFFLGKFIFGVNFGAEMTFASNSWRNYVDVPGGPAAGHSAISVGVVLGLLAE